MAEGLRAQLGVDLVLLGSGSIRKPQLGPIVTLKDYMEIFPFNDPLFAVKFTGEQLRRAVRYMLRDEAFADDGHTEWFQFSKGFFCEYDRATRSIVSMKMNGKEVADGDLFTVVLQEYHFMNMKENLDVGHDEAEKNGTAYEVATKCANVLQEYFKRHDHLELDGEQRIVIRG